MNPQNPPNPPKEQKTILTEDLKQFNIFCAMLHLNNHHFLEEACKLLVRKRQTKNIAEMVSYNKLLELVLRVKTNWDIVEKYVTKYKLTFICTKV
jgi:hypothetical protein